MNVRYVAAEAERVLEIVQCRPAAEMLERESELCLLFCRLRGRGGAPNAAGLLAALEAARAACQG